MEGNFLSRYNNKLDEWSKLIENDPGNRRKYESDMSEYMIKCMPFMNLHIDDGEDKINTDNIFNVKETIGLKKKDIFTDYLVEVEKQNIYRPIQKTIDICLTCPDSNIIHYTQTADLVCDGCGVIIARAISEELTYKEEQETSEKIVNYSYKRENHFNEWLSQFQAQGDDYYTSRSHGTVAFRTQENEG